MRHHLAFLLTLLGANSFAQIACRLQPDQIGEQYGALLATSMVANGSGSYTIAGLVSMPSTGFVEKAYISAFSAPSVGLASKRLLTGRYDALKQVPGGGFITAGSRSFFGNDEAYVCRFNAALDTLWTSNFVRSLSDHVFDLDINASGFVSAGLISNYRVVVMRFDPAGNVLWSKEMPSGPYGPPVFQQVLVLCSGTNTYVLSIERNSNGNDDISVRILDGTGSETAHRVLGSSTSDEGLRAAELLSSGVAITTSIDDNSVGLIRLDQNLNLTASTMYCSSDGLDGFELLIEPGTENAFIGGMVMEPSSFSSIVWQTSSSGGGVGWARKINEWGFVTADMLFEGQNIVVPTSDDYGILVSYLDKSNGLVVASCEVGGVPTITLNPYPSFSILSFASTTVLNASFVRQWGGTVSLYASAIEACYTTTLPVELMEFRANAIGAVVKLDWVTATEHDNVHFIVERSSDGNTFEEVTRVDDVAGNSQQRTEYEAFDEHPLSGVSYYRLKQVDIDGTPAYSDIVPVQFTQTEILSAFPSPAAVSQMIRVTMPVEVLDSQGRIVASGKEISLAASGVYVLRSIDGQTFKVVVQ